MKKNTLDALSVIENLLCIFESEGVPLWVDSGTLLGLVRQGDLIEWDDDVDLGTVDNLISGKIFNIQEKMTRLGYFSFATDSKLAFVSFVDGKSMPFNVSIYKKYYDSYCTQFHVPATGFRRILLFVILRLLRIWKSHKLNCLKRTNVEREGGGLAFRYAQINVNRVANVEKFFKRVLTSRWFSLNVKNVIVPAFHFDSLERIKIDKCEVTIPFNYKNYLCLRYGCEWRKPIREWHHWKHDNAIGNPPEK